MKTMQQWFDEYGESHRNATNKLLHWFCVPLIFYSLIGLLSMIPFPDNVIPPSITSYFHWGTILIFLGLIFFFRLSVNIALGMAIFSAAIIFLVSATNEIFGGSAVYFFLAVFVVGWIGQFIGHKKEGAKPSFFKDIQFLMIGPAWLLHFIFRKAGISYVLLTLFLI